MTSEANIKRSLPQRYDAQFRQLALTLQRESGLDAAAFCRREGINPKTFYRWRKDLTPRRAKDTNGFGGHQGPKAPRPLFPFLPS